MNAVVARGKLKAYGRAFGSDILIDGNILEGNSWGDAISWREKATGWHNHSNGNGARRIWRRFELKQQEKSLKVIEGEKAVPPSLLQ